jgi:uncharacterized RDD family membrane protein YckC
VEPAASEPGARLGLPASGSGRVAPWGRRLLALILDWGLSYLVALAFAPAAGLHGAAQFLPLVIFVVECWVGTATLGGSIGQLACGLRVVRVVPGGRGGLVDPAHAGLRSVLLALVVPAVIYDADRRGLHDRAAGTVVLSRR